MSNDPMSNDPMSNDPMSNDPMLNDPMCNNSMSNDPVTNFSMPNDPMLKDPMSTTVVLWKILLLFILLGSDPTYFSCLIFPANYHCDSTHLFSPIRVYLARSASISISPINTTVPPIILQYCFGLKTVWINKGYCSRSPWPLFP
jgi:hypothetical protein